MSKVLIVEDEEAIADIEKDYLELSGFEVTICKDGTSGLAEALDGEYDICILDVMLPGIDGFEICKKVRETKNIPIIMVSAKKEDIDKIRGLGVGADGVIFILPSKIADFRMQIINSDGSEAEMCGNGIRCFAKCVKEANLTDKNKFTVETGAGIIVPEIMEDGTVHVDMGEPILEGDKIPVSGFGNNQVVNEDITVDGQTYKMTCVSMGNPHCIVFVDDINSVELEKIGPKFETNPVFPKKTNTEFVEVKNDKYVRMRVWERGAGITWACGTGSCATLVACVLNKRTQRTAQIELDGGILTIQWADNNRIYMTGPATKVFTATWAD